MKRPEDDGQAGWAGLEAEIAICRDAHAHLLTILDSLDVIVYVADMTTHEVLYVNKYAAGLFGDIVGKPCWQTIQTGQTGPCAFCTNDRLVAPDGTLLPTHIWEFRNLRNSRWYGIQDKAIRWVDGRIVRLEIATDITEKKRVQEHQQQIQKLAAMETLAGGIAHDFNNILSAIIGYNELALLKVEPGHEAAPLLAGIRKAGRRARGLVDQILTFSRASYAPLRPVHISPVVKESLKLLRTILPPSIALHQQIGPGLGAVMADPAQVYQIVMNLVTNAHQAIGGGPGEIRVGLERVEVDENLATTLPGLRPGTFLELAVSDTGAGMPEEVRRRVFDPFYTTKDKAENAGMGLSVVLGLVKSSGGAVGLESSPGKGTTFRVYLPVVEDGEEEVLSLPWARGRERLLFVDDEEPLATLGKQMLKHLGYEVTVATGGPQALEAFGRRREWFDLVITDLVMPGMTGLELARAILGQRPGLPVILSAGFTSPEDEEKARAAGVKAILPKPYEISELAAMVRAVLDGAGLTPPSS
ncbi:MAG: response regulator [Desulfobacteraceae bacterium]|nr:response regulator [Desulfobacteraceae bacterium]